MLNIAYSRWVTDLAHVETVIVDYRIRQEQKKKYKKWVATINQKYRKPKHNNTKK